MATTIKLDDDVKAKVDAMVQVGRFATADDVIRASVELLHDELLDFALTPAEMVAIRKGLADEAAGRVRDADEVFAELRDRFDAR